MSSPLTETGAGAVDGDRSARLGRLIRKQFGFVWRLSRLVRKIRPDVLHGYMGIANELCSLMGRLHGGRVVWGLRQSSRDPRQYDWLSRAFGHPDALPHILPPP